MTSDANGEFVVTDLAGAGLPFDLVTYNRFMDMTSLGNHDVIILNGHPSPIPLGQVLSKCQEAMQEGRKVFVNGEYCHRRYDSSGVQVEYLRMSQILFDLTSGTSGYVSGSPVVPPSIQKDPDLKSLYWQSFWVRDFGFNVPPVMSVSIGGKNFGCLYPDGGCLETSGAYNCGLLDYGKAVEYLRYGFTDPVGFANDRIEGKPIVSLEVHCDSTDDFAGIDGLDALSRDYNVPLINLLVYRNLSASAAQKWNSITNPLMTFGSHSWTHPQDWPSVADVAHETTDAISAQRLLVPQTKDYLNFSGSMNPTLTQMEWIYQSGLVYGGRGQEARKYKSPSGDYRTVQVLPTEAGWFRNLAQSAVTPFCLSQTLDSDYAVAQRGGDYVQLAQDNFARNVKYGLYTYGYIHDYMMSPDTVYYSNGTPMNVAIRNAVAYFSSQSVEFIQADELALRLRDFVAGWIDYEELPDGSLNVTVYRPSARANQVKIGYRGGLGAIASGSSVVSQHATGSHLYVDLIPETLSTLNVQFVVTPPIAPTISAPDYVDDSIHAAWSVSGPWVIAEYSYALGTSPGTDDVVGWTSSGGSDHCDIPNLQLTDGASYFLSVKARSDHGLWSDVATSSAIVGDLTPPEMSDVHATLIDIESIYVNCTAQDPVGRIVGYRYAVGSSPLSDDVLCWTSTVTQNYAWLGDLHLIPGQAYYVSAMARDSTGKWGSPCSTSGLEATYVGGLAGARKFADGTPVAIQEVIVTAAFPDCTYVESDDRSTGIRVLATGPYAAGDRVDVNGRLGTVAGARVINEALIDYLWHDEPVRPLGMLNRSVGGSSLDQYNPGVPGGIGLFNLGLLVKTWGQVTAFGSDHFYINSGSREPAGLSPSIKVDATGLTIPIQWTYVSVVGISAVEIVDSETHSVIRLRDQSDITQHQ